MTRPASPYLAPGFYDDALAKGRHRDIVGGRWDETGRIVLPVLLEFGLTPEDRFLDIGAGPLRIGRHVAAMLGAGQYWATDASGALMRRGWEVELDQATQVRLPPSQLVEDADFAFPNIPQDITFALAFAVFTHLPHADLRRALLSVHARFPQLRRFLFTVFLAPDAAAFAAPFRQADGVVTHPDRAPWHVLEQDVLSAGRDAGFALYRKDHRLPRGQTLFVAERG